MKILDLGEKQKVSYCIPNWLRDEQIKLAIEKIPDRIQNFDGKREEPVAIIGFGPSLKETWEKVREFRFVISCSGSHKFLIERDIIPTWHVEVDPRNHKIPLLGDPHPDVTYLPASTCHPDYFDHLLKYNAKVKLWHVFDNAAEGLRTLPPGEWAITGGCDVGLRSITIARFLGFTNQHIFGIDGSVPPDFKGRHAADHPKAFDPKNAVECNGREFITAPGMLESARQIFHELDMLGDVKPVFYGDGLVQEMAKNYKPKVSNKPIIAFSKGELISARHRDLNRQLHRDRLEYGVGGNKHTDTVLKLMEQTGVRSVLDYGCGKGTLGKDLANKGIPIFEYDPAVPGKEETPRPADLVVCTDVLEHVEPSKIYAVLGDLQRCIQQIGFFTIHTGPAIKKYADGTNTHLIQQGRQWWKNRLKAYFDIGMIKEVCPELYVVVARKQPKKAEGTA